MTSSSDLHGNCQRSGPWGRDAYRRGGTFAACHLLKTVEGWQDLGFGKFELRYLRDREKREVDFIVTRDSQPWFLLEVKQSDTRLSPGLRHFQDQTRAAHAFQMVMDLDYVQADCFEHRGPLVVPARTLLSHLLCQRPGVSATGASTSPKAVDIFPSIMYGFPYEDDTQHR